MTKTDCGSDLNNSQHSDLCVERRRPMTNLRRLRGQMLSTGVLLRVQKRHGNTKIGGKRWSLPSVLLPGEESLDEVDGTPTVVDQTALVSLRRNHAGDKGAAEEEGEGGGSLAEGVIVPLFVFVIR